MGERDLCSTFLLESVFTCKRFCFLPLIIFILRSKGNTKKIFAGITLPTGNSIPILPIFYLSLLDPIFSTNLKISRFPLLKNTFNNNFSHINFKKSVLEVFTSPLIHSFNKYLLSTYIIKPCIKCCWKK